jgi:hypothetical protein
MSFDHDKGNEITKSNASAIEYEIESLKNGHWNLFKRQYREFWTHAKEISSMFKTMKPLLREDRERLWAKFNSICEEVKRTQERGKESRQIDSKQKRDLVESKIKEAYYQAKGARSTSDLSQAKSLLNEALQWMKDGWGAFNAPTQLVQTALGSEGKLSREDRDQCWEKWKEANEVIGFRRQELWDSNYNHFRSKASDALNTAHHGDPREAKSKVKDVQRDMKGTQMSKPQFQAIHDLLDDAWQKANSRLKEAYREGQQKHEEWRDRMEGHIERWSNLIQKNEGVISGIKDDIDRCEEEERNARSSEHADRVRGWIEEKYQKISDIRETNRELEEKIHSAKSKIQN